MKRKSILASAALLASAAMLVACGNAPAEEPVHDGIYDIKTSLSGRDAYNGVIGAATGLAGKKVSFTYTEKTKVLVDANGGSTSFDSFRTDVTATTTGYIDFSTTDFYAYICTEYADANHPNAAYKKEGLIRKGADGDYETVTTDETHYTSLGTAFTAFAYTFSLMSKVANTKATTLNANSMILNDTAAWLYTTVGLNSTANEGLADWTGVKTTWGTNEASELVFKAEAPVIGYSTDQGVSDFGYSSTEPVANVYGKVGAEGYLNAWDVDIIGNRASLEFNIMNPAPIVTVTGNRSWRADYAAAEQAHKADIDHAEPEPEPEAKYATFSVVADAGVAAYSMKRMVLQGYNPTGIADITSVGKDEIVENLWFCISLTLGEDVTVTSVTVNGAEAKLVSGMYCVAVTEETNYAFTVVTSAADPASTKAFLNVLCDDGVTSTLFGYCLLSNPTDIKNYDVAGVDASAMTYFVVKPTLADGKQVDRVLCNGADITATAAQMGGWYGVKAAVAGFYQVTILTK